MRTKVTLVLLFLNVVVFFFIFHFERNWRTERVALEVRHRVLGAEAADIRSLEVESAVPGGSFGLERRDGGWFLTKPVAWSANPLAVNRIISDLQFLKNETSFSVSDVEKNGQSLADYGLDKPRLTVTFTSGGMDTTGRPPVTTTLLIGSATKFGDRLYLLSSGGDRINVVDRSLADSLTVPLDELLDDAILTVPVFEARSLNVQTAAPDYLHIRIRRDDGRWSFETPILARADRNAIEETITGLDKLRVKAFVPGNPTVSLPSSSPVFTVTIEGDNRHETLYIGQPAEGGGDYAQLEGRPALFVTAIPDSLMKILRDAQDLLRDPHVLEFDARSVTGITLAAPDRPDLALRRDAPGEAGEEPRWQIVPQNGAGQGPATLPADSAAVSRLLEQLAQLSAVRFQSDAPQASELENWGFNRPERVIALTLSGPRSAAGTSAPAEASQILLQIGLPAPRGNIAYARVANAPYVYAINPDILAETDVAPGAWRERVLRAVPAGARIEELKLTDLTTGKIILDWKPGAALSPDRGAAVQAAIASLRTLRARRFLQNSFSDQAMVGGASRPWKYRLDATVALPGGAGTVQTSVSSLWLAERTGGGEQAAGSKEFNAEFLIEQPLLDALWTLTYGSGRTAAAQGAMKLHRIALTGGVWLARGLWTLVLWCLWLALGTLLAVQLYVARTDQLEAPAFVKHALEDRLALSGVRATFGRTIFDPSGRILLENVALRLPGFDDPAVTARAVFVRLDLWSLLAGRFEPSEIRATGLSLRVPAMFSPTGRADQVVSDLDAAVIPRGDDITIEYLNFRLGGVAVSVRGGLHLATPAKRRGAPLPLAEFIVRDYAALSRQCDDAIEALAVLDHPLLWIDLQPSASTGAVADISLIARGLRLPGPAALSAADIQASCRFPPEPDPRSPVRVVLSARQLDLPRGIVVRNARAQLTVRLPAGRLRFDREAFRQAVLSASEASGLGVTVEDLLVSVEARGSSRVRGEIRGRIFGQPMRVEGEADPAAGSARFRFESRVPEAAIEAVAARTGGRAGRDLGKYAELAAPAALAGEARFGPHWKFSQATARFSVVGATIHGVRIDEARGLVSYDGRRLVSPEAFLRVGDSFARGTYEQDVPTREYRFVLDGALRPEAIGPWFPPQSWWHEFFRPFNFPGPPPAASVDVRGSWLGGHKAVVFAAVDSAKPVFRGVAFDRVRTRLFIGPGFEDGLELSAASGAHEGRGTFFRRYERDASAWEYLDFSVNSTFDLASARRLLGPKDDTVLEAFECDRAPTAVMTAHLAGPGGDPSRNEAHVEARSQGEFRFHDFPFDGVSFTADMRGDRITVSRFEGGFAGGTVTGHGSVTGRGAAQQVQFGLALKDASLGRSIAETEDFFARRSHEPIRPVSKFVQDKSNVRLDLAADAAGPGDDFLRYHGGGKVSIQGAQLGEVRMLGMLTALLPFTSLRFTTARADFRMDGPQLEFSDVDIAGANSAIQAHGTYALDKRQLDFKAKIFPFQKSKTLSKVLISSVLTPFSEFFEVKLTGSIDNPSWSFERGPTNILRKLTAPPPAPAGGGLKPN